MSFGRKDTAAILAGLIVVGILFPTFGVATVLWFLTYWLVMALGWAIDAIGKSDD